MAGLMQDAIGSVWPPRSSGISQRLLVYRVGPDAPTVALANPEIEWSSDEEETFEEGCLSIPGVVVDVDRAVHVRVRAKDEEGEDRVVEASGLEARVIQHEMDHLDGVLILDRTSREQRREAMKALREAERRAPSGADLGGRTRAHHPPRREPVILERWRSVRDALAVRAHGRSSASSGTIVPARRRRRALSWPARAGERPSGLAFDPRPRDPTLERGWPWGTAAASRGRTGASGRAVGGVQEARRSPLP